MAHHTHVTQKEAADTLAQQGFSKNTLGCLLATKAAAHANGYRKAKIRGRAERAEVYLHQLAVIADGRQEQLQEAGHGGSMECSHICRNPACFNPAHIVVEPKEINKQRNFCVQLKCTDCDKFITNCVHNPPCLF